MKKSETKICKGSERVQKEMLEVICKKVCVSVNSKLAKFTPIKFCVLLAPQNKYVPQIYKQHFSKTNYFSTTILILSSHHTYLLPPIFLFSFTIFDFIKSLLPFSKKSCLPCWSVKNIIKKNTIRCYQLNEPKNANIRTTI